VRRARSPRTAVCILRVESRGEAGVLITITTTPDVGTRSPAKTRSVANAAEALSLVASFLTDCEHGEIGCTGTS
jgi:hypothetical protein